MSELSEWHMEALRALAGKHWGTAGDVGRAAWPHMPRETVGVSASSALRDLEAEGYCERISQSPLGWKITNEGKAALHPNGNGQS